MKKLIAILFLASSGLGSLMADSNIGGRGGSFCERPIYNVEFSCILPSGDKVELNFQTRARACQAALKLPYPFIGADRLEKVTLEINDREVSQVKAMRVGLASLPGHSDRGARVTSAVDRVDLIFGATYLLSNEKTFSLRVNSLYGSPFSDISFKCKGSSILF